RDRHRPHDAQRHRAPPGRPARRRRLRPRRSARQRGRVIVPSLLRRRVRRVAPELVRPLPRGGADRRYDDAPYERALLAAVFGAGVVFLAADEGAGFTRMLGLCVVAAGLVFLSGRYFLKFERDVVASLRRVAALLLVSLALLVLARLARGSERLSLLLLP